jgi:hypothetical protein
MFQQMVAILRYSNVVAESNIRKVYFVPLHHCSCGGVLRIETAQAVLLMAFFGSPGADVFVVRGKSALT